MFEILLRILTSKKSVFVNINQEEVLGILRINNFTQDNFMSAYVHLKWQAVKYCRTKRKLFKFAKLFNLQNISSNIH